MDEGLTVIQQQAPRASHAVIVRAVSRTTEAAMGVPGEHRAGPCPEAQYPHPELREAVAGEPGADPAVETGCPAATAGSLASLSDPCRGHRDQPGVAGIHIVALSPALPDAGTDGLVDRHLQSPPT